MAAIWQTMCVGRQKYSYVDVIYMSLRCGLEQAQGSWTLHHPPITSPALMSRWDPDVQQSLVCQHKMQRHYKHSNILAACSWQALANSILWSCICKILHKYETQKRTKPTLSQREEMLSSALQIQRTWTVASLSKHRATFCVTFSHAEQKQLELCF